MVPRNSTGDHKFTMARSHIISHSSTMSLGSGNVSPTFNTANTVPQLKEVNRSFERQTTTKHKETKKEAPPPITSERVLELLFKEEKRKLYDYGYLHSLGCTFWSSD